MNSRDTHKIVRLENPFSEARRYKRRFARALKAWPSADAICADLAEDGVHRDVSTVTRWRNASNKSMPPVWLHDKLMDMAVEQTRQQIRALEQRLEEIGD